MLHKATDKRRLHSRIQQHLKSIPELRPFPEAVTRLVAACRNSEGTNKEIEEIIACDPSLSVRVLRLANSPLFCPTRDITSIAHAVTLLGRRRLKSISMSVAAANMLLSGTLENRWCQGSPADQRSTAPTDSTEKRFEE